VSASPPWLPPRLSYDDYDGEWDRFLRDAYAVFEQDFKGDLPLFEGRRVEYKRTVEGDWEEGFWHIASEKDPRTGMRQLEIRRCERVMWVRPIIMNSHDPAVLVWPDPWGGSIERPHLWLREADYLVVLEPKRSHYVLVTAHPTEYAHTKRSLAKRYERWLKMQAPPP
jgi:hypothetical protein